MVGLGKRELNSVATWSLVRLTVVMKQSFLGLRQDFVECVVYLRIFVCRIACRLIWIIDFIELPTISLKKIKLTFGIFSGNLATLLPVKVLRSNCSGSP